MKAKGLAVFVLSIGILAMSFAYADAQQTVVGTWNYITDVKAVQQAVDQGGTVYLKGNFFFGGNGSVTIKKDVQIIGQGEKDSMTKIAGGCEVFKTIIPDPYSPDIPGPKITIQNIHFQWALRNAIDFPYSSGATITGNKFNGFRIYPYRVFNKFGGTIHGITFGTFDVNVPHPEKRYVPGASTGNLVIKDNEIDLTNPRPAETLGIGVMISYTTGVTAHISGNKINNCGHASILTMDNFKDKDGKGDFVISGNQIVANPKGIDEPDDWQPNGILLGGVHLTNLKMDEYVKYRVENNFIKAQGMKPRGIVVLINNAIVQNNHISIEDPTARGIAVLGSKCRVLNNKIEGKGLCGIYMRELKDQFKDLLGYGNRLEANDFTKFNSTDGDVFIFKGAAKNIVIGESGTFNDQGSDNQIKGLKKVSQ